MIDRFSIDRSCPTWASKFCETKFARKSSPDASNGPSNVRDRIRELYYRENHPFVYWWHYMWTNHPVWSWWRVTAPYRWADWSIGVFVVRLQWFVRRTGHL